MLEAITGLSLASAAGLNAYIPLLGIGLLSRFTGIIELPAAWAWLENTWALAILGALLVLEVVVDKIPALDTVNDVLQSVVRPASGGLVFSAGASSSTVAVTDPEAFMHSSAFWPFVIGVVVALVPHILKMVSRPVINTMTAGVGASIMSTIEDIAAVIVTILAVVLPILALLLVVGAIFAIGRWVKRLRTKRQQRTIAAM